MRLLLDMGVSPRTSDFLTALGHDATHLFPQGLGRLSDSEIMTKAVRESRVVITFDLDFPHLLALQGAASPSLLLLRLHDTTVDEINRRVADAIARFGEELDRGAVVVIDAVKIRCRRLPLARQRPIHP
ncbi:MAG: DUF5615 family PIN-like protein [Tepidisphaeraceae bacterium]